MSGILYGMREDVILSSIACCLFLSFTKQHFLKITLSELHCEPLILLKDYISCSLSKHIRGLFVICFYSAQCILTEKFISSSLRGVTIMVITQHTVQFWALYYSNPSVIMATADLCSKL